MLVSSALPRGFYVLGAEPWVVLGRSKTTQLALFSDEISRRHAQITLEGGFFTVQDLGSANGTYINGQRVQRPRRLENEDVIRVGPIKLRFLVVEGTAEDLAARFDPRDARTSKCSREDAEKAARKSDLAGRFSGTVLLEALQLLELNRRSGELRVTSSEISGVLRFREGLIVDARVGLDKDDKAARLIVGLKSGEYAFETTAPDAQKGSLQLRPSALSIDSLRAQDEAMSRTRVLEDGFLDELPS